MSECTGEAECGNGVWEYPEECDGDELRGATCESLGYSGGTLACSAECTYDTSGCETGPICGNGIKEDGEECDGEDLDGESCESMGFEDGNLSCSDDCTFDVGECTGEGPECGNGILEYGEECDGEDLDGESCESMGFEDGDLHCSDSCTFDTSECTGETVLCGDGIIDEGEDCDGDNLGEENCRTQGFDGGTLTCDDTCSFDTTGCVDCGDLTYCDNECVDMNSNMDHCGECSNPCDGDQVCTGGFCVDLDTEWTLVPFPTNVEQIRAHDLATDGEYPYLGVVARAGGNNDRVVVAVHNGVTWEILGPSPSQGITNTLDHTISLDVHVTEDATQPYVLFGGSANTIDEPNIHVAAMTDAGWEEVGAPGYQSPCMMHFHLDLALNGTTPHIATYGSGGCGTGTGYAWYDGTNWSEHPSTTGFNGQIYLDSAGRPAIVYTDRAYVGASHTSTLMQTIHAMMWWDDQDEVWAPLVESLDMDAGTGQEEHMAATSDEDGNIYAAWAERIPDQMTDSYEIYVKKYDALSQEWTLIGPGKASVPENANDPSITLIGGNLWLAYVGSSDFNITPGGVMVMRYSEASGEWEQVGGLLNENASYEAYMPVIQGASGIPYVAFRERNQTNTQDLYVKRFVAVSITP